MAMELGLMKGGWSPGAWQIRVGRPAHRVAIVSSKCSETPGKPVVPDPQVLRTCQNHYIPMSEPHAYILRSLGNGHTATRKCPLSHSGMAVQSLASGCTVIPEWPYSRS